MENSSCTIAIGSAEIFEVKKSDNKIEFDCGSFLEKFNSNEMLFIASLLKINVLKKCVNGGVSYYTEPTKGVLKIHAPLFIEVDADVRSKLDILSYFGYNYTCMIIGGDEVYGLDSKLDAVKNEYLTYKTLIGLGEKTTIPSICKYDTLKVFMPQWIVANKSMLFASNHNQIRYLLIKNGRISHDETIYVSTKNTQYYIYKKTPEICEELGLYHTV